MYIRKIISILWILSIPMSILFSFEFSNGWVVGEKILQYYHLPVYSNGQVGWYFPGIGSLSFLAIGWIKCRQLFKKQYPKIGKYLLVGMLGFIIFLRGI